MTRPPRPAAGGEACHQCAAPLAADQHWCVVCGARQASARTDALALLFAERRVAEAAALLAATADPAAGASSRAGAHGAASAAPVTPVIAARRRRAALPAAMAALVGLFVVSGTSVSALAGSSQPPFTVVLPPQVAQQVAQAPPVAEAPVAEAPLVEAPPLDAGIVETPVEQTPVTETPVDEADETPAADPGDTTTDEDASPIRHVFMIVLGGTDVAGLTQDEAAAPYLAGTLAKSGTLLSRFTTVSDGALANRIALVSGQGPTRATLTDCTTYADVTPADALATGQTGGDGCVYGFETGHVGDQLRALERTWKAYTEPAAGSARARAAAGPRARAAAACRPDASTTRRNPFLWFHGTFEAEDCDERNVPLAQLEKDLASEETTPALAWIASDAQQGSAEADELLRRVVPLIQNSAAFNSGLIVITSDGPPPATPLPAPAPAPAPATPTTPIPTPPATTPVDPPATPAPPVTTTPTDPATTTPADPPTDPPTGTTPTDPPTQTTPTTTTPTQTTPTTTTPGLAPSAPRARAAAEAEVPAAAPSPELAPGPSSYPNVGGALTVGGGRRVGALLISPFTPSGSVDTTPSNAFTLLRTIEQIFGVDPLGYAGDDAVRPLPDRLFAVEP